MEVRVPKVKGSVGRGIDMDVGAGAGNKGGLRKKCPPVISTTAILDIGLKGDGCLFVAAYTLLAGPKRKSSSSHIEVAKLLSPAIDLFVRSSGKPKPKPVQPRIDILG